MEDLAMRTKLDMRRILEPVRILWGWIAQPIRDTFSDLQRAIHDHFPFLRERIAPWVRTSAPALGARVSRSTRHVVAKTGPEAPQALLVAAGYTAVFVAAWMFGRDVAVPANPPPAPVVSDRYRAMVQLAPDEQGRCARFEFDNRSGLMQPQASVPCEDYTAALPSPASSQPPPSPPSGTQGRINAISDYFKKTR
jgi:hypothetical protein